MDLDFKLFQLINQFAGKNELLDQLVILFTKYGPLLFMLAFVWLWFTMKGNRYENRKIVLFAITIAFITIGIDKIIEMSFFRERPFVQHDVTMLIDKTNDDPSFPSNHAAGSFALAFTVFWFRRKAGAIFIAFSTLMALSRLYVGVHYPLDITAGMLIALTVAMIILWKRDLFDRLFHFVIKTINQLPQKFSFK